jgi:hypothetical protein
MRSDAFKKLVTLEIEIHHTTDCKTRIHLLKEMNALFIEISSEEYELIDQLEYDLKSIRETSGFSEFPPNDNTKNYFNEALKDKDWGLVLALLRHNKGLCDSASKIKIIEQAWAGLGVSKLE